MFTVHVNRIWLSYFCENACSNKLEKDRLGPSKFSSLGYASVT